MATLQWEHAVQFVNQPEAAIEIFAGQQLRAVAGGRHPGWGTRNALSYFGLTYIEFLAIADPDELRAAMDKFLLSRDAARLLPENEALFRVALRSDDIDATYDQLRRTGVTVSPIVDGQRNDPQGYIIRWRIFTIDGDTDGLVYPFVLQWEIQLTVLHTVSLGSCATLTTVACGSESRACPSPLGINSASPLSRVNCSPRAMRSSTGPRLMKWNWALPATALKPTPNGRAVSMRR